MLQVPVRASNAHSGPANPHAAEQRKSNAGRKPYDTS
jgi:hypothetical protein